MDKKLNTERLKEHAKKINSKYTKMTMVIWTYQSLMEFRLTEFRRNGMSEECIQYLRGLYKKEINSYIERTLESEQNA